MPRVILFGDGETITLLNESGNPDAIIRSIQSGLWRPKLPDPTGPYQAIYNGDTIIVTRRLLESRKRSDVRLSPHELIVVQGMALNPRYYRGNFYRRGNLSFELMVLGSDHVFVSYSPGIAPRDSFSDGSTVILAGCRLRRDSLWGALRMIVESRAVVQLDNESAVLVDPMLDWNCQ